MTTNTSFELGTRFSSALLRGQQVTTKMAYYLGEKIVWASFLLSSLFIHNLVRCDESPPEILRDPSFLKLLATHYPGSVLSKPTKKPSSYSSGQSQWQDNYQPTSSGTGSDGGQTDQSGQYGQTGQSGQYGQSVQSGQYGQSGPSLLSPQQFVQTAPSQQYGPPTFSQSYGQSQQSLQYAPSGQSVRYAPPGQYGSRINQVNSSGYADVSTSYSIISSTSAPAEDPRNVRWNSYQRPTYQQHPSGSDTSLSYVAPQQYSRPVTYYAVKKAPQQTSKIVIVKKPPVKYIKMSPKVFMAKPMTYKKVSNYPAVYPFSYPVKKPYRRQTYTYLPYNTEIRQKIKPLQPSEYYDATPPRSNSPIKTNLSAELYQYYQTTMKPQLEYLERPVIQTRNNISQVQYDTYDERSEEVENTGYDSNTRGYYGDRLYMSTQVPDIVRSRQQAVQQQEYDDENDTIFD